MYLIMMKGVKQVLVRMGELAGVLLFQKEHPILTQSSIQPPTIIDTSGADDSFTAAYVVALIERQVTAEALRFAGTSSEIWLVLSVCSMLLFQQLP
jgi:sugar/nucleoside kinase (ribokinase family)